RTGAGESSRGAQRTGSNIRTIAAPHVHVIQTRSPPSSSPQSLVLEDEGFERRAEAGARRHSITWSARCSSVGGIVSLSAFAVLRLMTSSNVVGCSTGRSAGFAPLSILSTYTAAPLCKWKKFGPYVR